MATAGEKGRIWVEPYVRDGVHVEGYWRMGAALGDIFGRGAELAQVSAELIARAKAKRHKEGQGTRHTRTTTPVEGKDGTRDALLIQAKEFFASLEAEQQARIAGYADSDDRRLELYNNLTRDRLTRMTSVESGARVAVRVPASVLPGILDGGALLNVHDEGHLARDERVSDGYVIGRAQTERDVWNIGPGDRHPIYGYVATDNEDMDASLTKAFGEIKLTLKDTVRERTTVTYSDSLFISIESGDAVPSPIDRPSELSVVHWMNLAGVEVPVRYKGEPRPFRSDDFVEAQIHGRVTTGDIERVDFPDEAAATPDMTARLDAAGIPWTVGGP